MNKIKSLIFFIIWFISQTAFAASWDAWMFTWISWIEWEAGVAADVKKIKTGDFTVDDIPVILKLVTDYLMWFAGTISVIFIILWAYQIMMWWFKWEKTKGKTTITFAIGGFILSALSWVILKTIIDNFAL